MPLIRGRVTQQTSAKCGQRMMLMIGHQKNLSCSGHWPDVAKKSGPSLEDFVSLRASTKCGPNFAPCLRTLSRSELQPNVVQIVPLIRGLCHAADFDQMWPKMCPLSEDFVLLRTSSRCSPNMCPSLEDCVMLRTLIKCGPSMCPLTGDFVLLRSSTTYGSTMCSPSKKASTKQIGL